MIKEQNKGYFYLLPVIGILLIVVIFPLIYSLRVSLSKWDGFTQTVGKFIWLRNYHTLIFKDPRFLNAFKNSMILWISAGGVEIILGFFIAVLLNREFFFHRVVKAIVLLPMLVLPVGAGHIWKLIFNPLFGPVNYILEVLHLPAVNWLGSPKSALISIILTDVWQWTPFCFLIMYAGMQGLSSDVYDAAKVDGANAWQTITKITIPLLNKVFLVAVLFRSIDLFRVFDKIYILTSGGPGWSTETMPFYTYLLGFKRFDMDKAATLSFVLVILVSLISIFFISRFGKEEGV
jgi:multiple sugar transport system permease protein